MELAPLVAFSAKASWSIRLRRPLLELPTTFAELLRGHLVGVEALAEGLVAGYLETIKPVAGRGGVSGQCS